MDTQGTPDELKWQSATTYCAPHPSLVVPKKWKSGQENCPLSTLRLRSLYGNGGCDREFSFLGSLTSRHTVQVLILLGLSEPQLCVTVNVTLLFFSL